MLRASPSILQADSFPNAFLFQPISCFINPPIYTGLNPFCYESRDLFPAFGELGRDEGIALPCVKSCCEELGLDAGGDHESRAVVMNQGQGQVMREAPVDWTKLLYLVPRRNPDVQGMTLEGETVLLDLSTGRSYRLNSVGTAVWEQCDGSATLCDIQAVLRSRCELSPERAHDEVVSLVVQLGHDGLLQQSMA